MINRMSIFAAAVMLILTGCSSFDGQKARQEHVDSYRSLMEQQAEEEIIAQAPLTLDDCLRIAMENNLNVRVAEVQKRVAQLSRKVSFAQFVPKVSFNYNYTRWDPQPEVVTSSGSQSMHDERIREMTWNIQMSIFNPSTWFMYAMHKRGEEIAGLAADYTRQMIVLEVTTYYYYCLTIEEIQGVLDSRIRAAEKLAEQLEHYRAEGMVLPWQSEQARVNLASQKIQRERITQILEVTKGQLLTAMGQSPLVQIKLATPEPLNPPDGTLEDLIVEALLNHPRLRIADRAIEIEKEKVKTALTAFLPSLTGFANRVNTTDSFQKYSNFWMMGLSGAMTVFNGFANIHEYDAAKENVKKAALEREQATLALMIEVFRAYQNLQLTRDSIALTKANDKAAGARYEQVYQQWQEGLVDASELLAAAAERDMAQTAIIYTQFQAQVAIATLANAMGQTEIHYEEAKHDGQS